ncbi:MAG: O-antigen ligase family protein [Crocinitomicaceae bacterium]|nr:O-antigen ligase family protein [Crocinitomicaceae bacterium]
MGYKKVYEISLALMALLMLVSPKLITLGIILHFGITVVGLVKRKLVFGVNLMNALMVLLYFTYLVGTIYTNHPDIAGRYLEYKLSLVIFPLLFSFKLPGGLSLKYPSVGVFTGVIVLMILGLINSISLFVDSKSMSSFLSGHFSYIHHPTYFASFAFVGMLLVNYAKEQCWLGCEKWKYAILTMVMILGQVLSFSLAGILILLIYACFVFLKWVRNRFGKFIFIIVLIISPVVLLLTLSKTPGLKIQFETSKTFVLEYVSDPIAFISVEQNYAQGDEVRLIMWTVAALAFSEHPMGVGTGNVDEKLNQLLDDYCQLKMAAQNYNPHNQFLQTAVEVGVFGLIFFSSVIIYAFYLGFRFKSVLILFIGLNLGFNSLFESMFQRQSGIVFFVFWLCLSALMLLSTNNKSCKNV